MARARNLKPGFFKNEHLAELPPLTRLLFQALWCEADRTGRLEDRPLRIKAEYFPYDSYDVSTGLAQLQHSAGTFLTRYEVGGIRYIQVNNFPKHQNPHKAEQSKNFPPPPQPSEYPKEISSTIPAQCKHRACMVLAGLIPESLSLDSLLPESYPEEGFKVSLEREESLYACGKVDNPDETADKGLLEAQQRLVDKREKLKSGGDPDSKPGLGEPERRGEDGKPPGAEVIPLKPLMPVDAKAG
jgi:hypothetical protein